MRHDKLHDEYFEWLCDKVSGCRNNSRYTQLFEYLFNKEFTYILDMDENRFKDGIELRYRFAYEENYSDDDISNSFRREPCSVLEMMVALAVRCEDHIMEDAEFGNRTGVWFWDMLTNLGIDQACDGNFSVYEVDDIIERFLNREYEPDGRGGLFTVKNCEYDLRDIEIWYQLHLYLSTIN